MLSALKRSMRFALLRVLRFILRLRARDYVSPPAAVALVLAPHQDDETLGCGGLIALKRLAGAPVHVAFITDGSGSHPGHPSLSPPQLAELRAAEARTALGRLGVAYAAIHFLAALDGTLDRLDPVAQRDLTHQLAHLLRTLRPDEIFLPLRCDGSSEHEAAYRIFESALRASAVTAPVFEFPVWSWWSPRLLFRTLRSGRTVVRVNCRSVLDRKTSALAAYASQTIPTPPWTTPVLSPDFVSCFTVGEEYFFST